MVGREEQDRRKGSLGETVLAGGKFQEREEGLRPGGPQIPPGLGSLDSVGGGGGGRGLSCPEAGGGSETVEGGLAPGSWLQAPHQGGGGPGQGPASGLGRLAMGQAPTPCGVAPSRLSLLSLAFSPFALNSDLAFLSVLSIPTPRSIGLKSHVWVRDSCLISNPHTPGANPNAQGKGSHSNIAPPSPIKGGRR